MGRAARRVSWVVLTLALGCGASYADTPTDTPTDAGTSDAVAAVDGGAAPTWLPPEGTYRYRVNGRQRLSVGNPELREEGPVAPAQIRQGGEPGCWSFRLCLVSGKCDDAPSGAYSEVTWSFCVKDGQLEERGAEEKTKWLVLLDFQSTTSRYECAEGQALYAPNGFSVTSWSHVCQGSVAGKTYGTSGPYRFEGIEPVRVGPVDVPGYHFRQERSIAANAMGAPSGVYVGDWWFAANGLPLRVRRGVDLKTDIGFGVVDFRESTKDPTDAGVLVPNDCVLDALEPAPLADGG